MAANTSGRLARIANWVRRAPPRALRLFESVSPAALMPVIGVVGYLGGASLVIAEGWNHEQSAEVVFPKKDKDSRDGTSTVTKKPDEGGNGLGQAGARALNTMGGAATSAGQAAVNYGNAFAAGIGSFIGGAGGGSAGSSSSGGAASDKKPSRLNEMLGRILPNRTPPQPDFKPGTGGNRPAPETTGSLPKDEHRVTAGGRAHDAGQMAPGRVSPSLGEGMDRQSGRPGLPQTGAVRDTYQGPSRRDSAGPVGQRPAMGTRQSNSPSGFFGGFLGSAFRGTAQGGRGGGAVRGGGGGFHGGGRH